MLTRSLVLKMAGISGSAQVTAVSLVHRGTRVAHSSPGKKEEEKERGRTTLLHVKTSGIISPMFFKGQLIFVPDNIIILFLLK